MPERDGYIPGVPCWVDTSQSNPEAVLDFYSGLFGWEFEDAMPEGSDGHYFIGRIRGLPAAAVGSNPDDAPSAPTWNTFVAVESVDETTAKVRDAGGSVVHEALDVPGSGRVAFFSDPEGAVFGVWEAREFKGAGVVNEHGALVFNGLNTRDVESAKPFYNAVFGWTLLDLGGGGMWMRPGYGDYLEELNPGWKEQVVEFGAPEGFAEVVAAINPIPDDQPDTPPHWSVTFSVDDADVTAAKAAELGGTVIAEPFDAPWVRMAIINDPAGATFIASQFVLENKDL